jgi:hypothetical protein
LVFGFVIYNLLELQLYVPRQHRNHFKYNSEFLADRPSEMPKVKSRNIENIIRLCGSGVPFWETASQMF